MRKAGLPFEDRLSPAVVGPIGPYRDELADGTDPSVCEELLSVEALDSQADFGQVPFSELIGKFIRRRIGPDAPMIIPSCARPPLIRPACRCALL